MSTISILQNTLLKIQNQGSVLNYLNSIQCSHGKTGKRNKSWNTEIASSRTETWATSLAVFVFSGHRYGRFQKNLFCRTCKWCSSCNVLFIQLHFCILFLFFSLVVSLFYSVSGLQTGNCCAAKWLSPAWTEIAVSTGEPLHITSDHHVAGQLCLPCNLDAKSFGAIHCGSSWPVTCLGAVRMNAERLSCGTISSIHAGEGF